MSPTSPELNLSFRKASVQDAASISELVNSAYRGDLSKKGWTTEAEFLSGQRTDTLAIEDILLSPHQWMLVCETDRKIVGSVQLEKIRPAVCYFGMFAVDPGLQSKGIGKLFLRAAEDFARDELRCQWMEMTVINLRYELMAWYERRGYQKSQELRDFPYGNERFGIPLRPDLSLVVFQKRL